MRDIIARFVTHGGSDGIFVNYCPWTICVDRSSLAELGEALKVVVRPLMCASTMRIQRTGRTDVVVCQKTKSKNIACFTAPFCRLGMVEFGIVSGIGRVAIE